MSATRIFLLGFDADGCLYNRKYLKIFIELFNRHWDFFWDVINKNLNAEELKLAEEKISVIIQELKNVEFYENDEELIDIDILKEIKNESFAQYISDIKSKFAKLNIKNPDLAALYLWNAKFLGKMNKLHPNFHTELFLTANRQLITHLCQGKQTTDKLTLSILSNRQSYFHDKAGMEQNGTGSIYLNIQDMCKDMEKVLQAKNCKVNSFSMGDLYANLARGTSFRKIAEEHLHDGLTGSLYKDHANYVYDETKLSLVYAFVHDAITYLLPELNITDPSVPIIFELFDDREDILQSLIKVFSAYPQLIPENVTINFHRYHGQSQPIMVDSVTGKGLVDHDYRENVKLMATMCGHDLQDFTQTIDVANKLDVEKFLRERLITKKAAINQHRLFSPQSGAKMTNFLEIIHPLFP